ncbi:YHYH protein [Flavobacterium faecale]|uniref:YHYH protein n=1 Tax=Flavobacterium faecale TaxID=1355330 RepID=A0A2S1L9R3_9FLAO|nr:YHYH protein [Flavobacterium faecale]AWG20493.1 YHYH protein [Flavobacterium faecale]
MKKLNIITTGISMLALAVTIYSCSSSSDSSSTDTSTDTSTATLSTAFAEFSSNVTVTKSGSNVTLKTTGLPNHKSPYWSNTTARTTDGIATAASATNHALFETPEENGGTTTYANMAPGNIDNFTGSYSLTVPVSPSKASSTSATGLGAIGIAISGAMIYNDEEGPGIALSGAVGSLDVCGAHTGPQSYHYHLEPKKWSNDDVKLIGIIADGFFLYGRKCSSTGTYPADLDSSGGHTSTTQFSTTAVYHYHIKNELYLSKYYILFPGDYQGTPKTIQ